MDVRSSVQGHLYLYVTYVLNLKQFWHSSAGFSGTSSQPKAECAKLDCTIARLTPAGVLVSVLVPNIGMTSDNLN